MDALFLRILNMSLTACPLILAVLFARLLLQKGPAALRVVLWALVGVRLCCPLSVESVLSLIPSAEPISSSAIVETVVPPPIDPVLSPTVAGDTPPTVNTVPPLVIDSGLPAVDAAVNPLIAQSVAAAPAASVHPLQVAATVAAGLWVVGVAGLLVYAAMSYWRIRRRVRVCLPLDDAAYICDGIVSPFIFGIFRPRIYLPSGLSDEALSHILAHEQAHLRRRDHWIKPFGYLVLAVHWFNPLVWVAYIVLCRDIELACDERVVRTLDADGKRAYSRTLLDCGAHRRVVAACPLAFGETGLKARIKAVLHYKKPAFWLSLVGVLLIFAAAVFFLTNPRKAPAAEPSSEPPLAALEAPEGFAATVISANMEDGYRLLVMPETAAMREKYGERVSVETEVTYEVSQPYTSPYVRAGDRVWIETGDARFTTDGEAALLYPVVGHIRLPENATVTDGETIALTKFLSARENNGFIGSLNMYAAPQDADLQWVLYDGAGIGRTGEQLTEAEIAAGVPNENVPVTVYAREDIETLLKKKLGVSIADLKNGTQGLTYFENPDVYALYHTDTNMFSVVVDVIAGKDAVYTVQYHAENDASQVFLVTLRRTADGFQFVSNVKQTVTTSTTVGLTTASTTGTTTQPVPDTVKNNQTVILLVTDDTIVVDAQGYYIHTNDARYAGEKQLAFAVDAPRLFAVGERVTITHNGEFTDGNPPVGKPLYIRKEYAETYITASTTQPKAPINPAMTFDPTCADYIGLTYAEAVEKLGEKSSHEYYRGGPFMQFAQSKGKLLFEDTDVSFVQAPVVAANSRCYKVNTTVGAVFHNTGERIHLTDIERVLGCQVSLRSDMAHGDHQILFTYNGHEYIIEIYPASDYVTPNDRILIQ